MWSTAKDAMLKSGSNLAELLEAIEKVNETINQSISIPLDVLLGPPAFKSEVVGWSSSAIRYESKMITSNMPCTLFGSLP